MLIISFAWTTAAVLAVEPAETPPALHVGKEIKVDGETKYVNSIERVCGDSLLHIVVYLYGLSDTPPSEWLTLYDGAKDEQ